MKTPKFGKIFTLLIAASAALIATAHPQAARTVMVNSNTGVLLFPTNLWSANAANARSGLSLGSAATNPASAFQPSSTILSNLASSNGAGLTNLTAANVTGTVALASNVTGTIAISNGGTGATNAAAARVNLGLGDTNNVTFSSAVFNGGISLNYNEIGWEGGVLFDLETEQINGTWNFVSAVSFGDVAGTRENLGLGFNQVPEIKGITIIDTNGSPSTAGIRLQSNSIIAFDRETPASQATFTNTMMIFGYGGNVATGSGVTFNVPFGFTTNVNVDYVRTNLGLPLAALTNTNVTNFRSDIGLGSAATNSASAFQPSSSVLSNLANNNGASLTNITVSNLGTISVVNGGTGATNVEAARTNLGLGSTNTVQFDSLSAKKWTIPIYSSGGVLVGSNTIAATSSVIEFTHFGTLGLSVAGEEAIFNGYITNGKGITVGTDASGSTSYGISFASNNTGGAAITRTNLGLGSSWLTSTNNPVFVNTNGEVVSPTNFWQVAPIQTLVQSIIPVTNSTNAATNARNLYAYSLATNIINVTNTITLPTNTSSFDGDEVTVIHRGGSNSVTAVRQLGSTNNLISLNSYDESVKFIKDGNWDFYHNISFMEAIRFSGTNAAANAGASRTNLGLGATWLTNTNVTNFRTAVGLGETDYVTFSNVSTIGMTIMDETNAQIAFEGNSAAVTRTNLGIPLAALTNTNNATFQEAIFVTNSIPTNSANVNSIGFNTAVAWMEVSIVTNSVTNSYRIPLFK